VYARARGGQGRWTAGWWNELEAELKTQGMLAWVKERVSSIAHGMRAAATDSLRAGTGRASACARTTLSHAAHVLAVTKGGRQISGDIAIDAMREAYAHDHM
jgi:hypothetical protein